MFGSPRLTDPLSNLLTTNLLTTMPIFCPINVPRITTEEFGELDYDVMGLAFASHRDLGRLADENVYQADLLARLVDAGYQVQRNVPITARFRTFSKTYYMDAIVAGKAIYELKTVTRLTADHEAQLLNYLLMVDCGHGKLINFRPTSVESRFVNSPITLKRRRSFVVKDQDWRGDSSIKDSVVELLCDWGTCLELPLYSQAFINLWGGEEIVIRQLPLRRGDICLGNQRFQLLEPDAAFRITAFEKLTRGYDTQLKRLLNLSQLKCIHWINIAHEEVTFTTITRITRNL